MKLINERILIRSVAERWRRQYLEGSTIPDPEGLIPKKLAALDVDTATSKDVADIIGNYSWCTPLMCDECGAMVESVVRVGGEDQEVDICLRCVKRALFWMEEEES